MYEHFFKLDEMPFGLTPNTAFYCALAPHNEAMQVLLTALNMGEGFIKVTGEVGTGKTLLCRKLLNQFDDSYAIAYLPDSYLSPAELRWAIAIELGIEVDKQVDPHTLCQALSHHLLHLKQQKKQVVIVIDEAQSLSWESLEALRLLSNLETETEKLMQVVMFGQPELDKKLADHRIRQLRQRISFTLKLRPMSESEVVYYINHRLTIAGYQQSRLFPKALGLLIARASRGIPRLVNIICHKTLLIAYGKGKQKVTRKDVMLAIEDTQDCSKVNDYTWSFLMLSISVVFIALIWLSRQWQ